MKLKNDTVTIFDEVEKSIIFKALQIQFELGKHSSCNYFEQIKNSLS